MSNITTIQLDKSTVKALNELKVHPRQSYNEVIAALLSSKKRKSEYDEFLSLG